MTAHFIAIIGDRRMTKLMRAADLFETFKCVGDIHRITVHYNEGEEVDLERAARLIPTTVAAIEQANMIPVFVHLLSIEGDDHIILNKKLKVPYFRSEEYKVVSNGVNWFTVDELLSKLNLIQKDL